MYTESDFKNALVLYKSLVKVARTLNVEIEEPVWAELNSMNLKALDGYKSVLKNCEGLFLILPREDQYSDLKKYVNNTLKIPSQFILAQTLLKSKNMFGVARNVFKGLQAKMGNDLFNLKFSKPATSKKTMLIGIDVCHKESQSIVGFCASYNNEMSQYYSAIAE